MQGTSNWAVVALVSCFAAACSQAVGTESGDEAGDVGSVTQALSDSQFASADFGFVGATWDWAGRGKLTNIELVVADWACDGKPVYGYLEYGDGYGWWDRTPTNRYDYSGCDLGDDTIYRGLSFSTTAGDIAYVFPVVCLPGIKCVAGYLSGRNPYVP